MRLSRKQLADIRNFLLTFVAGIGLFLIMFMPFMIIN